MLSSFLRGFFQALQVPGVVSSFSASELVSMEATITCQHPVPDLYSFHGKIEVKNNSETSSGSLSIENLLLRGARVKDTEHAIGCVIFTGQDTKLSLNSKLTTNKFSTVEKYVSEVNTEILSQL